MTIGRAVGEMQALPTTIEFEIECRSHPDKRSDSTHSVSIGTDWSVATPHDLKAEKVAAQFGNYTSCVDLVEKAIPAVRASLPVVLRRATVMLDRFNSRGTAGRAAAETGPWGLRDRVGGCCGFEFDSIRQATGHARSWAHIAKATGAAHWQVKVVLQAFGSLIQPPTEVTELAQESILEPTGVADLWAMGVHPDRIVAYAGVSPFSSRQLPTGYFTSMEHPSAETDWVRDLLASARERLDNSGENHG
jgi:hypothetical protein